MPQLKVYVSRMDESGQTVLQASRDVWETLADGRHILDWHLVTEISQRLGEADGDVIQMRFSRADARLIQKVASEE